MSHEGETIEYAVLEAKEVPEDDDSEFDYVSIGLDAEEEDQAAFEDEDEDDEDLATALASLKAGAPPTPYKNTALKAGRVTRDSSSCLAAAQHIGMHHTRLTGPCTQTECEGPAEHNQRQAHRGGRLHPQLPHQDRAQAQSGVLQHRVVRAAVHGPHQRGIRQGRARHLRAQRGAERAM
eukprot:scaffold699_cov231-Pinguiococcus_pyrenoidosus.AAC.19